MSHPQQWALRFQPAYKQWSQGSSILRDSFQLDAVMKRPDVLKVDARFHKILNPRLEVVVTTDKFLEFSVGIEYGANGPVHVVKPDCPKDYFLTWNGQPLIHHFGHRALVPNHYHDNTKEIANYIVDRYVTKPLGDGVYYVDAVCYDWFQDNLEWPSIMKPDGTVEHVELPESEKKLAIEFRELMVDVMRDRFKLPIYFNPGSGTEWLAENESIGGHIMEGIKHGGTPQQITEDLARWADKDKTVFFASRPIDEQNSVDPIEWSPGNTHDFRTVRSDICRALVFGHPISASMGFAYESYGTYDEMGVNLGEPLENQPTFVGDRWQRAFDNGFAVYSDDPIEGTADVSLYRITGSQCPEVNDGSHRGLLLPPIQSSTHESRKIGDGVIYMNKPTTIVSDMIAGVDWMRSSPGQKPLEFHGEWEPRDAGECLSGENPLLDRMYWAPGPVSNSDITFGAPFNGFGEMVAEDGRENYTKAEFKIVIPGEYERCVWMDGVWLRWGTTDAHAGETIAITSRGNAAMLRYIDKAHVKRATSFTVNASDADSNDISIISMRDRCFALEFDGYVDPFTLRVASNGVLSTPPFKLQGREWGPRRESFFVAVTFPEFKVDGPGVVKYMDLVIEGLPPVAVGVVG